MRVVLGLAAAVCVTTVLLAQGRVNPTDPQPTCDMCPGTYIPLAELNAYTKKAMAVWMSRWASMTEAVRVKGP